MNPLFFWGGESLFSKFNMEVQFILVKKTIDEFTNRWQYTHRTLRSAAQTVKEMLPFLFTYQDYPDLCIPNTNNPIEGLFTALKSGLRNHNGMSHTNKERFVNGFFRHRGYRPDEKKKGSSV